MNRGYTKNTIIKTIALITILGLMPNTYTHAMKRKFEAEKIDKNIKKKNKTNKEFLLHDCLHFDEKKQIDIQQPHGKNFYDFVNYLKNIEEIIITTYEQEKKDKKYSEYSLHNLLKKYNVSEESFLRQISSYFCQATKNIFVAYCQMCQATKENNELYEKIIAYVKDDKEFKSYHIFKEFQNIYNKQNIVIPSMKDLQKDLSCKAPEMRSSCLLQKINQFTYIHKKMLAKNIKNCSTLIRYIKKAAEKVGITAPSIEISDIFAIQVKTNTLMVSPYDIHLYKFSDLEIFSILLHEAGHEKNSNDDLVASILKDFFTQISQEKFTLMSQEKKHVCNFIQKNIFLLNSYIKKINELLADAEIFKNISMMPQISSLAKELIIKKQLYSVEPIFNNQEHLHPKERILFWAHILKNKKEICPWDTNTSSLLTSHEKIGFKNFLNQEHISFALFTLIDSLKMIQKKNLEKNSMNYISYLFATLKNYLIAVQEKKPLIINEEDLYNAFYQAIGNENIKTLNNFYELLTKDINLEKQVDIFNAIMCDYKK